MEHGGYDQLSAERMQWRSLTKHFGFHGQQEAANTFQLKTTYYKNLAYGPMLHTAPKMNN